jgi:hypothetical protein
MLLSIERHKKDDSAILVFQKENKTLKENIQKLTDKVIEQDKKLNR